MKHIYFEDRGFIRITIMKYKIQQQTWESQKDANEKNSALALYIYVLSIFEINSTCEAVSIRLKTRVHSRKTNEVCDLDQLTMQNILIENCANPTSSKT